MTWPWATMTAPTGTSSSSAARSASCRARRMNRTSSSERGHRSLDVHRLEGQTGQASVQPRGKGVRSAHVGLQRGKAWPVACSGRCPASVRAGSNTETQTVPTRSLPSSACSGWPGVGTEWRWPQGRRGQAGSCSRSGTDRSRALQGGGQVCIRRVAPHRDVTVLARTHAPVGPRRSSRALGCLGHPLAQGRFHQRAMRLHATDHAHLEPGLGWRWGWRCLVSRLSTPMCAMWGWTSRWPRRSAQRHFARFEVRNPQLVERRAQRFTTARAGAS